MKATATQVTVTVATCQTCEWRCEARNALAAGSVHAQKHRHSVVVREERLVFFDSTPPARQQNAEARLPL